MVEAESLARAGDLVISTRPIETSLRNQWPTHRVELLYEFAFLRMFLEWEKFLEDTFMRYMCGYASTRGACTPATGTNYYGRIGDAEAAMLRGRQFALWHNPNHVVSRSQRFFTNGFHETVISSNLSELEHMASVRHRIVHDQTDAMTNFDAATMNFVGRRYRGSRPGRFLRDWDSSVSPQQRWLVTFGLRLSGLARQIA